MGPSPLDRRGKYGFRPYVRTAQLLTKNPAAVVAYCPTFVCPTSIAARTGSVSRGTVDLVSADTAPRDSKMSDCNIGD
jgi:hypothetical protein